MIEDIFYYRHNKYGSQKNIDNHQIKFHWKNHTIYSIQKTTKLKNKNDFPTLKTQKNEIAYNSNLIQKPQKTIYLDFLSIIEIM